MWDQAALAVSSVHGLPVARDERLPVVPFLAIAGDGNDAHHGLQHLIALLWIGLEPGEDLPALRMRARG